MTMNKVTDMEKKDNDMNRLIPVARHNPTVFVRSDLVATMNIVIHSTHVELQILLTLGTTVCERFDSLTEASDAAVRICNLCNQGK
jgi:hypothetical protein